MSRYMLWVILVAVFLSGCATYRPIPLTRQAVAGRLIGPDMKNIRIRAKEIKHPILKSIEFNDSDGLSPDEAAVLAVLANPRLRAIRDRQNIANAQLLQAGLLPNPRLSYGMDFPTGGETDETVNAFGVGLNWDIGSLITHQAKVYAAQASAGSVNLEIAWQEWQVAEAAKLHVYRLLIAEKLLALAKKIESERRQTRSIITNAVKLSEKTALDLSTANNAWRQARLAVAAAEQQRQRERFALNQTLGLAADRVIPLQQDINLPAWQNVPSTAMVVDEIENRRLDLLALKVGYESQEARVRAAVKSQFPRINIGLSNERDIDNVRTMGFGVTIELPFFNQNQGRIAIERATRQQLFDEYTVRLFDAQSEIARILSALQYTRDRFQTVEESIPALNRLVHSYKSAAEDGIVDILTFYKALGNLYSSQIQSLILKQQLAELGIALEIATGRYLPASNIQSNAPSDSNQTAKKEVLK